MRWGLRWKSRSPLALPTALRRGSPSLASVAFCLRVAARLSLQVHDVEAVSSQERVRERASVPAPTTSVPPIKVKGRRISLGSSSIMATSWSSSKNDRWRPSFLKEGLFQEKSSEVERWAISPRSSSSEKRSAKKSRSSSLTPLCKSHALTLRQVLQRFHA